MNDGKIFNLLRKNATIMVNIVRVHGDSVSFRVYIASEPKEIINITEVISDECYLKTGCIKGRVCISIKNRPSWEEFFKICLELFDIKYKGKVLVL